MEELWGMWYLALLSEKKRKKSMKYQYLISLTAMMILSLFLGGCTSKEIKGDDPDSLYEIAEREFKDEKYLIAIEKYRDLKNRYPYSARAVDAELRIADAYFEQESYLEAESAYEVFRELHPTHPKIAYVQYRIGLSYFNQIPANPARDLSAAYRAIDAFDTLLQKYPGSEYTEKAKENLVESKKRILEYENYVANFYYQREHFLSASYRYNTILKEFSNLGLDEEALFRLGTSYFNIKMFGNAKDAFLRLLKEFPNTTYKQEAQAKLDALK
jgi:outer membrane protein assembly factor BamD